MLKSSLLEIIRTFTKQELIKFEDFVRSPYHNKKENVLKLFLFIKKYFPGFDDISLSKEIVWNDVFPETEYNYGIMKNLIFELNKLAEQFIILLKFNKDEYKQDEYLVSSLLDRGLNKMYLNKFNTIDKEPDIIYLNANKIEIEEYLSFKINLYEMKLLYHQQFDQNFKPEILQLKYDSYKLSAFLLHLFPSYANSIVSKVTKNIDPVNNPAFRFLEQIYPVLENVIESIEKDSKDIYQYIKIYYLMILALKENTESSYLRFKKILFDNLNIIPKFNMQSLHYSLFLALSIVIDCRLNRFKETLEIFDSLIKNDIIGGIKNEIVPIHIFHVYISNCFKLSDSAKIELFASRYIDRLEPKLVDSTKTYVKFMISFLNKDFKDALNQIVLCEVPYSSNKIALKTYKAMCIYELGDYEMYLNELDSQKHFVKNNTYISESRIRNLNNYFFAIKKLFNLKQNFNRYEFYKLKDFVTNSFKDWNAWIYEKLDEIEKANSAK